MGLAVDLLVTKTSVFAANAVTYYVGAFNAGTLTVLGARVVDDVPDALVDVAWTCNALDGATCAASGFGDLDELVDLPPGAFAEFVITATIGPQPPPTLVNEASISSSVDDPDVDNNVARVEDTLLLFGDGFEVP